MDTIEHIISKIRSIFMKRQQPLSFLEEKPSEVAYRFWVDRMMPYYLSARILLLNYSQTNETGAFCAFQAIENIFKGALYYHNDRENALKYSHDLKKLLKTLKKHNILFSKSTSKQIGKFKRYQNIARYPESKNGSIGSGLCIHASIIDDLDRIIFKVISQIPDKEVNRLKNYLEHNSKDIPELANNNKYFERLKRFYFE